MRNAVTDWENELWSYISTGDGDNCPLYDNCEQRLCGGWCISDHKEYIIQMIDDTLIASDNYDYDFLSRIIPGRVFKLVEMLADRYLSMGSIFSPPVPESMIKLTDSHLAKD